MTSAHADVGAYTDLMLIGTPDTIAALTHAAQRAGALIHRTAPQPMGGHDPRHRVYLRLLLPH